MRKMAMAAGLAAALISGGAHAAGNVPSVPHDFVLTDEQAQSIGCIVMGSAGAATAAILGPVEMVAVIGGGPLFFPSSPLVAATAVGALVFASFCSVGQAVTPAVVFAAGYAKEEIRTAGWDTWAGEQWAALRNTDVSGTAQAVASSANEAAQAVASGAQGVVNGAWEMAAAMFAGPQTTATARAWQVDEDVTITQVGYNVNLDIVLR